MCFPKRGQRPKAQDHLMPALQMSWGGGGIQLLTNLCVSQWPPTGAGGKPPCALSSLPAFRLFVREITADPTELETGESAVNGTDRTQGSGSDPRWRHLEEAVLGNRRASGT